MLDSSGYVAEATGANVFMVKDRVLYTPPASSVLEGITRAQVIQIAKSVGVFDWRSVILNQSPLRVVEAPITRDQLYGADEVFVTGTAAEIVAIRELDFRTIGNGGIGPICRALQHWYKMIVTGKVPHFSNTLTIVPQIQAPQRGQ